MPDMSQPPAREQQQLTRRSSFRKSLAETALPEEYLVQLEEKRKQLDESIHKYIAAKERDYKSYEKELRHQHRAAQGQNGSSGASGRRLSPETVLERPNVGAASSASARTQTTHAQDAHAENLDRSTVAGLRDRRASVERDKDFVGLFTPVYLPAIDDREQRELERTTSAPPSPMPTTDREHPGSRSERSNSDTVVQAKPKRPSHLALTQRTSSSGSSADGRLPSVLKSPSQQFGQQPKRKRVSLAVGDEIVAPSDSVPAPRSHSNTPSHSRQRMSGARRELTPLSQATTQPTTINDDPTAMASIPTGQPGTVMQNTEDSMDTSRDEILVSSISTALPARQLHSPRLGKLDPDGDLFDLEAVEEVPIQQPHDYENALDSDDEEEDQDDEIKGRIDIDADDLSPPMDSDSGSVRYDPTTGMIPEPEDGTDSAVPYLAFGPSSAVASQQPIKPGFRRPSVIDDPVYQGMNYNIAEQDAVDNEIYGSSFSRPTSKGSFTAGSLGESYMAKHAAEMMKMRASRRQTEVES